MFIEAAVSTFCLQAMALWYPWQLLPLTWMAAQWWRPTVHCTATIVPSLLVARLTTRLLQQADRRAILPISILVSHAVGLDGVTIRRWLAGERAKHLAVEHGGHWVHWVLAAHREGYLSRHVLRLPVW